MNLTPFNNRVNSQSNFEFQKETKNSAFSRGPEKVDMEYSLGLTREALNQVGMTGVLEFKRALVGESGAKQPEYAKPKSRSRSRHRHMKGKTKKEITKEPEFVPKVYRPINRDLFILAFEQNRIKVPEKDIVTIFNTLCERGKDTITFQYLWRVLLPNLSENGVMITSYLWNTINPQKLPEFNLSKMKNRFFGKFDPDVQKRKRQEREVENEFIRNLDTYCQVGVTGGGKICKEEFDGFMKCWAFTSDSERQFLMRVVECFRLNEFTGEFGIEGTVGNEVNQGWRKEWGQRQEREVKQSRPDTWGNFTQGKEEIKRSRRGRGKSVYGKSQYERNQRSTPWADDSTQFRNPERERNTSKYSRRFEAEKKSTGIFHQRNSDVDSRSHRRRQYKSAQKNHDIFNRGHALESEEGVKLLVSRLRGVLKAFRLRAYDLIYLANALIKSYLIGGSVSGKELSEILGAVSVRWDLDKCDSVAKHFLSTKRGIIELLDLLKGRFSGRKQTMEMKLWSRLDFHSKGFTYYGNLLSLFKADYHPLVNSRKLRTIEVKKEFEEGMKLFDQIKLFISESRVAEDYGANNNDFRNSMVRPTEDLENQVFKMREFNEWFSFYSFEEDDDNRFEAMYRDVFKIY